MALTGRHLLVGAEDWNPWVKIIKDDDGTPVTAEGISFDFLNSIASKLNFTYTISRPVDGEWGRRMPNGSYTGMIGQCRRKEVDLAVGPFVTSWVRFQAADFSSTLHFDQYAIMVPRPRVEADLSGVAKPLAYQVWVALAMTWLISSIVCLLMNQIMKLSVKYRSTSPKVESDNTIKLSWIIRSILADPVDPLPKSIPGRLFLMSWLLICLILQKSYGSVLISLLAVPKVTISVDSLEDLATYGKIPWVIEIGSHVHGLFMKAESGIYKDIYDGGTYSRNFQKDQDWIKQDGFAVISPLVAMKKFMSEDFSRTGKCFSYIAREAVVSSAFAFAFPKDSDVIQHFNQWLNRLKEAGIVSDSIEKGARNATACLVRPGKEVNTVLKPLSMMDLSGSFLIFGVGLMISLFALIMEKGVFALQEK